MDLRISPDLPGFRAAASEAGRPRGDLVALRRYLGRRQPVLMGEVLGDLNARRGHVREMEARDGVQVIRAEAPLVEMFGYATDLRSLTKGRASHTMEPRNFERVPEPLQAGILNR